MVNFVIVLVKTGILTVHVYRTEGLAIYYTFGSPKTVTFLHDPLPTINGQFLDVQIYHFYLKNIFITHYFYARPVLL